jgi:CspA family cold shock protein
MSTDIFTGRVKWFNNKAGYGFITITDGDRSGSDIFVHHSAIMINNQQYKYLVQGEYIEFSLNKVESDKHEWQASNVNGIKGGKLMCETRHDFKMSKTNYKTENSPSSEPETPQQRPPRKEYVSKPVANVDDTKAWSLADNKAEKKPRGRPPRKTAESK